MGCRVGGGMADAADLKSAGVNPMWVRIPPDLPTSILHRNLAGKNFLKSCGSNCSAGFSFIDNPAFFCVGRFVSVKRALLRLEVGRPGPE